MARTNQQDSSTFEDTRPMAEQQKFDIGALEAWMHGHMAGFAGPLTVEQFKGGRSNPTFKLIMPPRIYMMRARSNPKAKLLPSAHVIEREYRVIDTLAKTDVPVAKMVALCEDEAVIGRAFYIMKFVQDHVLWGQAPPGMAPAERNAIYDEMNRITSALYTVDYAAVGLANYGKSGNYFAHQIERWNKQYELSETESIPIMDSLIGWLPKRVPQGTEEITSIVHGDYRPDDLIFRPTEPRMLAILGWELSALGHPLAGFSYHCVSWHIEPGQFRGMIGLGFAALSIPTEAEYIRRYGERTDRRITGDWNFYLAYNMFRIAGILQEIMKRVVDGAASSAQTMGAGKRARPMTELGWKYVQQAGA